MTGILRVKKKNARTPGKHKIHLRNVGSISVTYRIIIQIHIVKHLKSTVHKKGKEFALNIILSY